MNDATTNTDATDFEAARDACRRRDRAAFYISHCLPQHKRHGVWGIVAGCHMIRDAIVGAGADGGGDCCSGGGGMLERVRERVDRMYDSGTVTFSPERGTATLSAGTSEEMMDGQASGKGDCPPGPRPNPIPEDRAREKDQTQCVLSALTQTVRRFEIPRAVMTEFVETCAAEASVTRYATWTALRQHCEALGGAVAKMIACVLGVTNSDAAEQIVAAGQAGCLIEILRDIAADAGRDRIYLPLEDMVRCRYGERDLLAGVADQRFERVVAIEVERGRKSLQRAADGVCWLAGDGARLAAAAWVELELAMLDEIERCNRDLLKHPPMLSAARVLRRLPGAWRLARRRSDEAPARVQ